MRIEMTARYFDAPLSVKKISDVTNYKKRGGLFNAQLVRALEKLTFNVEAGYDNTWGKLRSANTKDRVIIVSWMLKGYIGHFSVVDKVTKNHVYLAEPTEGVIIKMQKLVFLRLWFDFDPHWYPKKNTDIKLRFMAVVSKP